MSGGTRAFNKRADRMQPRQAPNRQMYPFDSHARFQSAFRTRDLTWAAQEELSALGDARSVAKGQEAGLCSCDDSLVFVSMGACKLVARASQGREQVISFHFPGDLVSVPSKGEHVYDLHALTDLKLLVFPAMRFLNAICEEAGLLAELHRRSDAALRDCRDDSVGLGRKTAQERVARFLLCMADRIGRTRDGALCVELPMSRSDIADSLGLTIETVSRQFGELRAAGAIETVGRSGVRLLDCDGLAQRASHHLKRQ